MTGDKDKLYPFRKMTPLEDDPSTAILLITRMYRVMPPTWQHRRLLPPTDTAKTLTHGSIPLREMQNDLYTSDDLEITPRQNGWEILGHLLTMSPRVAQCIPITMKHATTCFSEK